MSTEKKIILNRIRCDECKDIIISRHVHDYVTCKCGNASVDGGSSYCKRGWKDGKTYTEMCVYSDAPFEEIRELLTWGSFGKEGNQSIYYYPISKMETGHLMVVSQLKISATIKKFMKEELEYRKENNIADMGRVCKLVEK